MQKQKTATPMARREPCLHFADLCFLALDLSRLCVLVGGHACALTHTHTNTHTHAHTHTRTHEHSFPPKSPLDSLLFRTAGHGHNLLAFQDALFSFILKSLPAPGPRSLDLLQAQVARACPGPSLRLFLRIAHSLWLHPSHLHRHSIRLGLRLWWLQRTSAQGIGPRIGEALYEGPLFRNAAFYIDALT